MTENIPKDISEYPSWLMEKGYAIDLNQYADYYDNITKVMKEQLEKSVFWNQIKNNLSNYDSEYEKNNNGYRLLANNEPKFIIKSFNSFFNKTYRKNFIENKNIPDPPEKGWLLPNSWFSQIHDILRTSFVVRYLDGVIFLVNKLQNICDENRKNKECEYLAKEQGYHAAHVCYQENFEIPKLGIGTEIINVFIEIQVRTQIQDTIKDLLWMYYQKNRGALPNKEQVWQWDVESREFATNYLGHILHYVDGMIVGIRKKEP